MSSLTPFQQSALSVIGHDGGTIVYESDRSWRSKTGTRLYVPAADRRTEGFIGWPTISALMAGGFLVCKRGNEYMLTGATI